VRLICIILADQMGTFRAPLDVTGTVDTDVLQKRVLWFFC
jgi:hypothetical protein